MPDAPAPADKNREAAARTSDALLARVRAGDDLSRRDRLSLVARLSIPAILSQLSVTVMQYIDASMVGALGVEQSASVGLVSSTTWLFSWVATSAAIGFTVQVAQLLGAGRNRDARAVMLQGFVACAAVGMALGVLGLLVAPGLPAWLGGSQKICADAQTYFTIIVAGLPVNALVALVGGMLQSSGNMRVPSIANVFACVLDALLDLLLIYPSGMRALPWGTVWMPGADLGVAGAAIASIVSLALPTLPAAWLLLRRSEMLRLRSGDRLRMRAATLATAARIAVPVAVENAVFAGALVITTRIVAPLGPAAISANSFATTAEGLCYMPGYGIGTAATTMVGQAVGAGRKDVARGLGWLSVACGMLAMGLAASVMYLFAPQIIGLLSPVAEVRELGARVLRIVAFAEPLYAASIVASGSLRGAGDTLAASLMNFASLWAIRIPLSIVLASLLGLPGVWLAMSVELCLRGVIFLVRLRGRRWLEHDVTRASV